MADQRDVVFGAGGGAGQAIVAALVKLRRPVRAVYHHPPRSSPTGVEAVTLDVTDPKAVSAAAAGAGTIYHAVNVPYQRWVRELPALTGNIAAAAETVGARLVYLDNLYCYGDTRGAPMTETTPQAATDRKGRLRAQLADDLLRRQAEGRLTVLIARASDYYGPGGLNAMAGERVFGAAVRGGSPGFLGTPGMPHAYVYLEDLGRAIALLGTRADAAGGVWHVPHGEPLTGEQFAELIGAALGRPVRPSYTPSLLLAVAGLFSPLIREVRALEYEFRGPYLVDSTKFEKAFGPFEVTPHRDAIAATLRWFSTRTR